MGAGCQKPQYDLVVLGNRYDPRSASSEYEEFDVPSALNMVISASRIGLSCVYIGTFMEKSGIPAVLDAENVKSMNMSGGDGDAFIIPTEVKDVIHNAKAFYCSSLLLTEYPQHMWMLLLDCLDKGATSLFYDHRDPPGSRKNLTSIQNEGLDQLLKDCKMLFVILDKQNYQHSSPPFLDEELGSRIPWIIVKYGPHHCFLLHKTCIGRVSLRWILFTHVDGKKALRLESALGSSTLCIPNTLFSWRMQLKQLS